MKDVARAFKDEERRQLGWRLGEQLCAVTHRNVLIGILDSLNTHIDYSFSIIDLLEINRADERHMIGWGLGQHFWLAMHSKAIEGIVDSLNFYLTTRGDLATIRREKRDEVTEAAVEGVLIFNIYNDAEQTGGGSDAG